MPKLLPLSKGLFTLIDDQDFERASAFKWNAGAAGKYVVRIENVGGSKEHGRQAVYLHRFLLGAEPGTTVDHINGDGLDNRRANLRFASLSQNGHNRHRIRADSKTGLLGVHQEVSGRYSSKIKVNRKSVHLGTFDTAAEALAAVQTARLLLVWGLVDGEVAS